jgi:protein-S-isoprenylcysteine O-methyltransferase Ste14
MKAMNAHRILSAIWIVWGLVWAAGAIRNKQTLKTQSSASRKWQALMVIAGFMLLGTRLGRIGPLGWRFLPDEEWVAWMGTAITAAGAVWAIWARFLLGRNWSSRVTIKKDHSFVRGGPYRFVRHPIYTGALAALLGAAIVQGTIGGLLAVAMAMAGWWGKSRLEEEFMVAQFGSEYQQYRREVKALIPYLL